MLVVVNLQFNVKVLEVFIEHELHKFLSLLRHVYESLGACVVLPEHLAHVYLNLNLSILIIFNLLVILYLKQ